MRYEVSLGGRKTVTVEADSVRAARAEVARLTSVDAPDDEWIPTYSPWRHGGWYVDNIRYPSGAVGCVSRNYADRRWRIACDPRPFDTAPTFPNRDAAARAERLLARTMEDA